MSHRDPLPFKTVEWLWEELTKVYGHQFLARWEGLNTPAIKEDWRYRLAGLSPHQVAYGVENLPGGRPPDVIVFREICLRMPDAPRAALPPPRPARGVPSHMRAVVDHLLTPQRRGEEPAKVTVARRYVRRFDGQKDLTPRQRDNLEHYRAILQRWELLNAIQVPGGLTS